MKMMTTLAVPDAVDYIFSNLWERGARELAMIGLSTDRARAIADHQCSIGMPTMAIWFDGEPVLICGLMSTDHPNAMVTWFQATEMFTHYAREITVEVRKQLEHVARARNLDYVEIISPCVHPRTGRWFRALGFRLDVDRYIPVANCPGERLYRFVRRFSREDSHVLPPS